MPYLWNHNPALLQLLWQQMNIGPSHDEPRHVGAGWLALNPAAGVLVEGEEEFLSGLDRPGIPVAETLKVVRRNKRLWPSLWERAAKHAPLVVKVGQELLGA